MKKGKTLDAGTLRKIAVTANTDPRTVLSVLRGETTKKNRSMARERARKALAEHGYIEPELEDLEGDDE